MSTPKSCTRAVEGTTSGGTDPARRSLPAATCHRGLPGPRTTLAAGSPPLQLLGGEVEHVVWSRVLSPRAVTEIARHPDGRFRVRLDGEVDVFAAVVIIASGVRYRRLPLPGLADLEGRGVYYAASQLEATAIAGRDVVVVGGANSAGQAALFLAQYASHVHILIRRDTLNETMSSYLTERVTHHERITIHPRSELFSVHGTDRLTAATWHDHAREVDLHLDVAGVFLLIGAAPCTTALSAVGVELDEKGYVLTRDGYSTSVPGLFAVGGVRAGSVKRVASAVGEGSVVISSVHAYLSELGPRRGPK